MKTLSVILYDIPNRTVAMDKILPIDEAYQLFNTVTDIYEQKGWFMVKEEKIDTNTAVREFATAKNGHIFDLIICDGRVENIIKHEA